MSQGDDDENWCFIMMCSLFWMAIVSEYWNVFWKNKVFIYSEYFSLLVILLKQREVNELSQKELIAKHFKNPTEKNAENLLYFKGLLTDYKRQQNRYNNFIFLSKYQQKQWA